jgi:hypothetical protein
MVLLGEKEMKAVMTEHEQMMIDIMNFTATVVRLTEMREYPAEMRADAIMIAEQLFHKMVMGKIVEKCVEKSTPSTN